jgi:hypothetical protein
MLPEGRGAHVRAIRQVVPVQRLNEVLLEPGDRLRNLLARGPGRDKVPELWAVRTGQQEDGDFLLDEWRQPGNQCWLAQQLDESDEGIEQGVVEWFERDGSIGILSPRPRLVHLGSHLNDRADIQRQHHAKKRFRDTGARDMRDDREIDRRQHGLPRAVVDRLVPKQDLLVAFRDDAKAQVVNAVQGFGWRFSARPSAWRRQLFGRSWIRPAIPGRRLVHLARRHHRRQGRRT